jgi:hypothetical protein
MSDQTTFESNGRRGMHAIITIRRDGRKVGWIEYSCYSWHVCDYYGQTLRGSEKLDAAKQIALTIDFPDPQPLYEQVCNNVERNRRKYAEQTTAHVAALNAAARDLIAGADYANERIAEVFAAIERYAKDNQGGHWKPANGAYHYHQNQTYYPDPPEPARAAE